MIKKIMNGIYADLILDLLAAFVTVGMVWFLVYMVAYAIDKGA